WAELKRRIQKLNPPPRTTDQLWEHVQEIWYSEDFGEYVRHLYMMFPHRIQGLLDKKGRWLKY
ncbi:hypothetical protein F5878DRAFT_361920, partial [Lentinula raphanica]